MPVVAENASVAVLRTEQYCGPIPSASELEKYKRVYRNAAPEILAMARNEQEMRSFALTATHNENMRMCGIMSHGQLYAFLVFVGMIGAGCYAIHCGMGSVAGWAFGMVGMFAAGYGVRVFAFAPKNSPKRRGNDANDDNHN